MSGELMIREAVIDTTVEDLQEENRRLRADLRDAKMDAMRARQDTDRALAALRKQLGPLYRALQAVFGELDAAGVQDGDGPQPRTDARVTAVWNSWKEKMPGGPARIIDALLLHGDLTTPQLKITAKMATQTVYDSIARLKKAGLIDKNGGKFSLKQV